MSLCARSLVGSALRALPRRAVRSSRDATPLGTSGGRRRSARAVRGVVSAASSGDADVASTRAVAPPWKEEVLESHSLLGNVCFVLCGPQGPQNVGSVARVMQNFGVTDLRIVSPEPTALAPPFDAADEYDRAIHSAEVRATAPLSDEAHKFAVHADWLLRDAKRCANADEALADVTYVAATTARPRENLQIVDVKAAAAALREHAAKGEKVAVVFGNEATGLTNDELSRANLGVMIATAGSKASVKAANRRRRYTGAKGPTSLNLSMAVGVLAYEPFEAMGEGEVGGFGSRMMTVDERARLGDELAGARRSLDVMREGEESSGEESSSEEDRLLDEKEARAIARVLNAGPIATKDAAVLFQLARRTKSVKQFSGVDEAAVDAVVELLANSPNPDNPPGNKAVLNHVRTTLGLSLTTRELERVVKAAGKIDMADERLNRRSEGDYL